MMELEDTPIQRMLDELAPGERREHRRKIEPSGADARFWWVGMDGRIHDGSLRWLNKGREAQAKARYGQYQSVHDLEQPVFRFFPGKSPIGDLYWLGARGACAWGEPLAKTLAQLDPEGVEMRRATIEGVDVGRDFYLGLFLRQLDAIDLDRTNVSLIKYPPGPNGVAVGSATYPDGVYIRSDLPASVHCFCDLFTGRLFFSHALLDACEEAGVTGIYGRDPAESRTVIDKVLWTGAL